MIKNAKELRAVTKEGELLAMKKIIKHVIYQSSWNSIAVHFRL